MNEHQSALFCGCDPGINHYCERHRSIKNRDTEENREYWDRVEETAERVRQARRDPVRYAFSLSDLEAAFKAGLHTGLIGTDELTVAGTPEEMWESYRKRLK